MWEHSSEIAKIIRWISEKYGYAVFQNRKLCVSLCNDLLAKYEDERKVMRMLFLAGLGDSFTGLPYSGGQELLIGIQNVETFLKGQALEKGARENVAAIIEMAFMLDLSDDYDNPFKKSVFKTFDSVHFKMNLPEAVSFSDRIQFSFKFTYLSSGEPVDTILSKCTVVDRVNSAFESTDDYSFLERGFLGKAEISVPFKNGKKVFLTDSKVSFTFLCSNSEAVEVHYKVEKNQFPASGVKWLLEHIEKYRMTRLQNLEARDIFDKLKSTFMDGGDGGEDIGLSRGKSEERNTDDLPKYTSSDIKEFSDGLRQEIMFLKQGKGKKYRIVNGSKINKDNGIFTYSFEMETELHLPDSAPIVLDAGGIHAVGSVLSCEDFQIMLLVDRDLGDRVGTAFLMVEPWKLLESLNKKLVSLNSNLNALAVRLMEDGPDLSTDDDISKVPMGQSEVEAQLKKDDIVAVWGPPGTGKTYIMAKIANKYLQSGKSVLIVSHSNVSVDGVIKTVVSNLEEGMQSYLENGKILRFGYVRDDELAKNPYATSFNYTLSRCPDYSRELQRLTDKRDELRVKNQTRTGEYDRTEKEIKKVRESIRREERIYVQDAQLIGTTISRATIDPMFDERQFDLVMFDEVSMAYVPQVIVAAALAKEKFMFVGDFKQLPPISQNPDAKNILQVDIFSYLKIVDGRGNMFYHPWLVMLNEQRRMHPAISEFPNKAVYKGLLRDYDKVISARASIVSAEPLPGDALNLIDLSGSYCAASKNSDNSRFNLLSAFISFSTAVKAEKAGNKSVGIITPYAAQTRLIRAMLRDYYGTSDTVSCATVHQFQGSESDVLIFDAVESYPTNKVGFLMGKDFNQVLRLINVAITRARGKLITIANGRFWENTFKGTNHIYYKLLEHIKKNHNVIGNVDKTLKPYIQAVDPMRLLWIFTDEKDALTHLRADMDRAKGKVVVSIPVGKLYENEAAIMETIKMVDDCGVPVLMKSNDYENLPEEWKSYCWGTENALFPLIVIDDETAWFGLPLSEMRFKVDNRTSLLINCPVMVRIQGRYTIEMIKALTELETVAVGSNKRPLTPKNSASHPTPPVGGGIVPSVKRSTLAGFIEKKEFCPDCKSNMTLAKNMKGTAYLRCSNKTCKHMAYLSKDLIDWYIRAENVQCPRMDGGELRGGLGKYGPYVRCSEGHFLKPEEI